MRLLLAVLFAVGCSGPEPQRDMDLSAAWETLWDILDDRYESGDSRCYYAYYEATAVVMGSDEDVAGQCRGKRACVRAWFSEDLPLGAYTIVLRDSASRASACSSALHELVHVADHCLARNYDDWPLPGGGHPQELFDLGDGNGGVYPVELELDAMAQEACENG